MWSLSDRKYICRVHSSHSLFLYSRKIRLKYDLYLFVYVISYCKINLWGDMCDHSLIGKHILPHSLLLFLSCFFIEGKSCVWLFWCVKEKNFWNHYDQIGKHIVASALCYCISLFKEILWKYLPLIVKCEKKQIEKTHFVAFARLSLFFFIEGKSVIVIW